MPVLWLMADLPASEKCAVLTSDSCKGALLNEVCTHPCTTRGAVWGGYLLIKAEHQPLCLESIWRTNAISSLKLSESMIIKMSQVVLRTSWQAPELPLGVHPISHGTAPCPPRHPTVSLLKCKGGHQNAYIENQLSPSKCTWKIWSYCLNRLGRGISLIIEIFGNLS